MLRQVRIFTTRFFKINLGFLFCVSLAQAAGYYNVGFGFKNKTPKLKFTSASQNTYASICSGVVNLQTQSPSGAPKNVLSDLTVNLSGPGSLAFYSDAACTSSVSSVTILAGTSAANFYFLTTAVSSPLLVATATGYLQDSQSETLNTNPYIWLGGGGNVNWNNGGNWSGGAAPGSGNTAVFNSTCAANCSPTINVPINIGGVRMNTGYAGTITQAAGQSINIGNGSWAQFAGIFNGGASDISVIGSFVLLGGTFTSTSTNLLLPGSAIFTSQTNISSPSYFIHHSGTISFGTNNYSDGAVSINAPNVDFYNVTVGRYSPDRFVTFVAPLNVRGLLTFNSGWGCSGAVLNAYGDILMTANSANLYSSVVNIVGNGAQTLSGTSSGFALPATVIQKTGGTLTLSGTLAFSDSLTYTSGSVAAGTSTVFFGTGAYEDRAQTINLGSVHLNNVGFNPYNPGRLITITGNLFVDGNLTFDGGAAVTGGSIQVQGNTNFITNYAGYNTQIQFVGALAQTITVGASAHATSGNWTVNKAGGSLSLSSNVVIDSASQTLTITTGSMNMSGKNLTVGSNLALNSNTITKSAGTLTVNGTVVGSGALYGGTVAP